MSILAQCGFGRGDKIERALEAGSIDGVIMSPRDESEERLRGSVQGWEQDYPQAMVLFDPQFYAATLSAPRDGHLGEYDYYAANSGLSRTQFSPSKLRRYVEQCLGYQHCSLGSGLSYLVSPTILFDDFRDHWSQVALSMAEDIHLADELDRVLSGTSHDGIISSGPAAGASDWTDPIACLAHWESLSQLSQSVSNHGTTSARLEESVTLIGAARNLYSLLGNYGMNFDPATGASHLPEWELAVGEFRSIAGV